ncbi:hypothetical protein [Variovorax sp. HJSM1_2]|uniref:hypothetical protein n=1 Tax=Variovorax sp. HJSM1_2 TaxID=3366263 RepID=UPI003BDBF806
MIFECHNAILLIQANFAHISDDMHFPFNPSLSRPLCVAVLMGLLLLNQGIARAATFYVGPQDSPNKLREIVASAQDDDVVEIAPGQYLNWPLLIEGKRITLRGLGTRPVFASNGAATEGKALWVVRRGRVTVENIEFRGVRVASGNGAGIRFESGHLVVNRCAFIDNEMGLLTGNDADATLEVLNSEFGAAPRFQGGALHHLLYVGSIASVKVLGSHFQQGFQGHLLKSRARESRIFYNMLVDSSDGQASYELEFPNGGLAFVVGNIIGQSQTTANPALISFGAEGPRWPQNGLYLSHNTLLNPLSNGILVHSWQQKFSPPYEEWLVNNLVIGHGSLGSPLAGHAQGNYHTDRLLEVTNDPNALLAVARAASAYANTDAGTAHQQSLVPTAEFRLPAGTRALTLNRQRLAGALQ